MRPSRSTAPSSGSPAGVRAACEGPCLRITLANSVTHLPPTAAQLPGLVGGVYSIHPSHADLPGRTRPQGRATATGDCNGQC
jgi:hypothetical protein